MQAALHTFRRHPWDHAAPERRGVAPKLYLAFCVILLFRCDVWGIDMFLDQVDLEVTIGK